MSKRALVYVSKMAPVLSKRGLPGDTQLEMSTARATCGNVRVWALFVYQEAAMTAGKHYFP